MENFVFNSNTKLAAVYYNGGKTTPSVQDSHWCHSLRVEESVERNQPLTQPQRHTEGGWCWVSTYVDQLIRESAVQPDETRERRRRENHVLPFCKYNTRGPIELGESLVRFVEEIWKSLIRPTNYEEIKALLEAPDEEINLDDPWSTMCCTCFMLFYLSCYMYYLNFHYVLLK